MKEFLKKNFPGLIQFVKDTQQLIGYRKKKKYVKTNKIGIKLAKYGSSFHKSPLFF